MSCVGFISKKSEHLVLKATDSAIYRVDKSLKSTFIPLFDYLRRCKVLSILFLRLLTLPATHKAIIPGIRINIAIKTKITIATIIYEIPIQNTPC